MRGRPRKPDAIRKKEGYAGHSRPPQSEPQAPEFRGDAPDHLAGVALTEWKRLSAELKSMNIFSDIDRGVLEAYCIAFADFRAATAKLKKEGQVIKTAFGPARNPWAKVQKDAWAVMEKAGSKLGLSPVDRARLAVDEGKKKDDDDEFFGTGAGAPPRTGASA